MIEAQHDHEKQLRLIEIDTDQYSLPSSIGNSAFCDPAFASNKTLPLHRWVPWIAGFSSDFVKDALTRYLNGKGTVLDPFSGVGTTLIEAFLLGHNVIGFEVNPYPALACRTKLYAYRVSIETLRFEILRFQAFYNEKVISGYKPKSILPKGFKTRSEFYSPQVLHKVLILHDFIDTIESSDLKDLFTLAFASTMVRYSNYSYEPSLGRRVSGGKEEIRDFPVGQTILNKLWEMAQDIAWFQAHLQNDQASTQIINDSFFQYEDYLIPDSVDLIVTSPPGLCTMPSRSEISRKCKFW